MVVKLDYNRIFNRDIMNTTTRIWTSLRFFVHHSGAVLVPSSAIDPRPEMGAGPRGVGGDAQGGDGGGDFPHPARYWSSGFFIRRTCDNLILPLAMLGPLDTNP